MVSDDGGFGGVCILVIGGRKPQELFVTPHVVSRGKVVL